MSPFSGGDYTACFSHKGKVKPYEKMVGDDCSLKAFQKLGSTENVPEEGKVDLERYVCLLYSTKKNSRNDFCYSMPSFPRRATSLLRIFKSLDQYRSPMPGCVSSEDETHKYDREKPDLRNFAFLTT